MRQYKLSITLAALTAVVLSACAPTAVGGGSGGTAGGGPSVKLAIVGFAVPKAANDAAQKAFAETEQGKGATWTTSYGASGDQSRAVESGLEADYVHFSLEGDVTRLVEAGIVSSEWNSGEHRGIVSDSVVVLVVRDGNPKNITGWDDLLRNDVKIVTPNPGSSGSARWNILAAYGSVLAKGGDKQAAEEYLRKFFDNVAALPGSGRDATTAFTSGTGDVLISYENEAILARQNGEDFDYVVPDSTLLIENPAAVTRDADPAASRYLEFVLSDQGQKIFASKGFRPVRSTVTVGTVEGANEPSSPFPQPRTLQTIAGTFGGWQSVNDDFFSESGIVTRIQSEAGKQ
ncbi:sulfate ABC transporter substrate-binding protein [Timonella senegalensis]|uniref:sulfate ABC transporter substrate-binding protein n=1 Tax=Timonella senegalensis TaxID=1465825 RepID=UPI002FDEBCE0